MKMLSDLMQNQVKKYFHNIFREYVFWTNGFGHQFCEIFNMRLKLLEISYHLFLNMGNILD